MGRFFGKKLRKKLNYFSARGTSLPLDRKIDQFFARLSSEESRVLLFFRRLRQTKIKIVPDSSQNENENDDTHLSGIGTLSTVFTAR